MNYFVFFIIFVSSVSCGRREYKNPAKYSTGAPTDDNPIIYNFPGSDSEEKKETENSNEKCADHLQECDGKSSFTERNLETDDVWEVATRSNCCKGLVCKVGSPTGTKGVCERS